MSLHDEGGHPAITSFRDFESSQAARVIILLFTKNYTVHFIPKICLITPNIWQNQNSRTKSEAKKHSLIEFGDG